MRENAPIGKIGWYATLGLVAVYVARWLVPELAAWLIYLAWFLTGIVTTVLLAEVCLTIRDYRRGLLIPMRNATFFIIIFSLLATPFLVYNLGADAGARDFSSLLLLPAFLYTFVRNLFYVYLDDVSFTAKTGLASGVTIPRFSITVEAEGESRLVVRGRGGAEVHLLRSFFFPSHWERLKRQLLP